VQNGSLGKAGAAINPGGLFTFSRQIPIWQGVGIVVWKTESISHPGADQSARLPSDGHAGHQEWEPASAECPQTGRSHILWLEPIRSSKCSNSIYNHDTRRALKAVSRESWEASTQPASSRRDFCLFLEGELGSCKLSSDSHIEFDADLRRYEALLEMADLMVHRHSLPELFLAMAERLRQVVAADAANFFLYDPTSNVMRLHFWKGNEVSSVPDVAVEASPSGWTWQNQQPLVMNDLQMESRFPLVLNDLREQGLKSYCWLPLTTAEKRLGALGLGSSRINAYTRRDMRLLPRVAQLIAVAVENALTREALVREKERLQTLLEVNNTLVTTRNLQKLFPAISVFIRRMVRHDLASVAVYDEGAHSLSFYPLDSPLTTGLAGVDSTVPVRETPAGHALRERKTKIFTRDELKGMPSSFVTQMLEQGIQSLCCIPLTTRKGELGTLNLASRDGHAFAASDIGFLEQVAAQVAVALDNARAYREIAELTNKLASEKLYLEEEIRAELNFEEIVGESGALKKVLSQARTVASSDATVLILGDTGTGKELIARAIHRMSSRKERVFVKLNCAAIPTGLLESELFGHERGAFTGAITQKVGRLELADKGSLFLDEVGDIPLELQPKLLRVLQDQEFERLGSTRTIKVNIRLIAATNRDLAHMVGGKEFRSDLYYRLNVFPIHMPALTERRTDIPMLVRHFVQKFARRMNKQIETIPSATMNALVNWEWHGNIRELENLMERSVILSDGPVLNVPRAELAGTGEIANSDGTLESLERQYIIRTLRETKGVIAGPGGAALRLGMKRTTLQSRILKMGISRQEYR
jgi:formate hydrogenlyase transcriptional activator